jgi:FkbM family methyltransferase
MATSFEIDGVKLDVPKQVLSTAIASALTKGRYEGAERAALKKHLQPDDTYLDLGAGIGLTCAIAAQIIGSGNVMGIEANPILIPAIEKNLINNGCEGVDILQGGITHRTDLETLELRFGAGFWGGSTLEDARGQNRVMVPAVNFQSIVRVSGATVVGMDVEGAELNLLEDELPLHLRLISMEIHPKRYGLKGIQKIMRNAFDQGFGYCPQGSARDHICFARI